MNIEDIRLKPEEIDVVLCDEYGIIYRAEAIIPRTKADQAIADTATNKVVKEIVVDFVLKQPRMSEKDWGYGLFMREIDIVALKKLVKDVK